MPLRTLSATQPVVEEYDVIRRTVKLFKRRVKTWSDKDERHVELVRRVTYWFLVIPIYSREEIASTNL